MISIISAQIYIPADPFDILFFEKKIIFGKEPPIALLLRPVFISGNQSKSKWSLKVRNEFFYNSGAPNLENMSDRWIGKGVGYFSSLNFVYRNRYIAFSAEPYYFISQNDDYDEPQRIPKFSQLNDNRPHIESPYISYGIRELQAYANYKGIGAGYSNANMWWGPGIHSSIMMTNNTSGFGHIFVGTIEEKRYNKWGFNWRYVFAKFDERTRYQPYFNAFAMSISYYSNFGTMLTIGMTKSAIIGGLYERSDSVSWQDAAFSALTLGVITDAFGRAEYSKNWNYDDNMAAAYIIAKIPKSDLVLFFEIGRNDVIWDLIDFILFPDHSIATNIGIRKYSLFNNKKLFFGIEYAKIFKPRLLQHLSSGDWYDREGFDFNSYNGRRWAAHSGSDSDDFLIIFGWLDDSFAILPSFNYERHGASQPTSRSGTDLILNQVNDIWPETKLEFRLDIRYKYKSYKLNLYYEREIILNLESRDKTRKGNVIWIGIERDIDKLFKKNKS